MSLLQINEPEPADLAFGQGEGTTVGASISLTSIPHGAYYDPKWADRLANSLGVEAAYQQLENVPEQLIFVAEMVLNNASTGFAQGVRQHALELKAIASRFGSLPLAFAALGVANHEIAPSQQTLTELLRLSHAVSSEMRSHLLDLDRLRWAH
jgi:hypothetical protein